MKSHITYMQLSLLAIVLGFIMYILKHHVFPWGNVTMPFYGATFNDLWYFNLSAWQDVFFSGSLACFATYMLERVKDSGLLFALKYSTIAIALVLSIRAIAHIVTYNRVSSIEMAVVLAAFIYTVKRAVKWYKTYMKTNVTRRIVMEDN